LTEEQKKLEILRAAACISDNMLAALLIEYYVSGRTIEETAQSIRRGKRQTLRLYQKAIQEINRLNLFS